MLSQWGDRIEQMEAQFQGMVVPVSSQLRLENPEVQNPQWTRSPLYSFHAYRTSNLSVNINTWTPVVFETSTGDSSFFGFYENNKQKLKVYKYSIRVSGVLDWAASTAGDRVVRINVFNAAGASLGSKEMDSRPANLSAGFGLKQGFNYVEDILYQAPLAAYCQLEVFQNAANPLNVENSVVSVGFG